jgi:F0F1-type ATP synthase epsilon subunit
MAETGALRVEVVSPERVLFSGEATQVITRTLDGGEIAFLPGHISFLGALVENHTRIYLTGGAVQDDSFRLCRTCSRYRHRSCSCR